MSLKKRPACTGAILILLCLAAVVLCAIPVAAALPQVGQSASDFKLRNINGGYVSLSELRGRPVLIMFWGPGCGYCKQMFPSLISAYPGWVKNYNAEILSIGYSWDPPAVQRVATQYRLNFPVLLIDGKTENNYGVRVVPAFYLVDGDGIIRYSMIGSDSVANLEKQIKAITK